MQIVFSRLTFIILGIVAILFAISAWLPIFKQIGIGADLALLLLLIVDYQLTPRPNVLSATREVNDRLSIGRKNSVVVRVTNTGSTPLHCIGKDDYPDKMEVDYKQFIFDLKPAGLSQLEYNITPRRRGAYRLGDVDCTLSKFLAFISQASALQSSERD